MDGIFRTVPKFLKTNGKNGLERVVWLGVVVIGSSIPESTIKLAIKNSMSEEAPKYFRAVPEFESCRLVVNIRRLKWIVDGREVPYSPGAERHYRVRLSIKKTETQA